MQTLITYVGGFLAVVIILAIIGWTGLRLYKQSNKERAFVRTGGGVDKVVLTGGAFVLPGIHSMSHVNMKTLRLDVEKKEGDSLGTKDRFRVDVRVEFYVRVKADAESVAKAAQTLGQLTLDPVALKKQIEAKFVDALRAVAQKLTMYDLNSDRASFVQQVRQVVAEDIAQNGLELESVSLTALNQTEKKWFDPNNALDAEGLLALTRETEQRRKLVNDIEQDTKVQIQTKNLASEQDQQKLRKATEEVRLQTDQEVATLRATQEARIAADQAEARKNSESATIQANRDIEAARIGAEQVTKEKKIEADAAVKIADQAQAIRVAQKSEEQAAADAKASKARAEAVQAEEQVTTARDVEVANRNKQVTLVKAEERAQEKATEITVYAKAEQEAADNRARALIREAEGARDAAVARAEGVIAEGEAVAKALAAKTDAQNTLSPAQIELQRSLAILAALPEIIARAVKPIENIESIRIAEVGGLNGLTHGEAGASTVAGGAGPQDLVGSAVNGALRYRAHGPLVDNLMQSVGLPGLGNVTKLVAGATALGHSDIASAAAATAAAAPEASAAHAE